MPANRIQEIIRATEGIGNHVLTRPACGTVVQQGTQGTLCPAQCLAALLEVASSLVLRRGADLIVERVITLVRFAGHRRTVVVLNGVKIGWVELVIDGADK